TTMSDFMDRTLGLGYATGSMILVSILVAIFALWRISGDSLNVNKVQTFRGELFYWMAILFSNTLGTALGDFLADDSGLGFAGGALLIGASIAVVVLLKYFTRISSVLLFWVAFVLTRPFGATLGDFLTKPHEKGGLDFGTIGSSAVLAAVLVVMIAGAAYAQRRYGRQAAAELS
ncbi:MAG: COG4705 family protein, partial [Pseudomonas sp.]